MAPDWTIEQITYDRPPLRVYDRLTHWEYVGRLWIHPHESQVEVVFSRHRWESHDPYRDHPSPTRVSLWVSWDQVIQALNSDTPLVT